MLKYLHSYIRLLYTAFYYVQIYKYLNYIHKYDDVHNNYMFYYRMKQIFAWFVFVVHLSWDILIHVCLGSISHSDSLKLYC